MTKLTEARERIGGVSKPGKMPCDAWSIPASKCITGSKLVNIPGSVCADCYALKGRNRFPVVQNAQQRRLTAYDSPTWPQDMATSINGADHFRWFDSGDLQSLEMLESIADVAKLTPNTSHWLPTREKKIFRQFTRKHGDFPANLCVRVSATMVDGDAPDFPNTSTVHRDKASQVNAFRCKAPQQAGKCGDCRACWDRDVQTVSYKWH